jgi:hypothetical protein
MARKNPNLLGANNALEAWWNIVCPMSQAAQAGDLLAVKRLYGIAHVSTTLLEAVAHHQPLLVAEVAGKKSEMPITFSWDKETNKARLKWAEGIKLGSNLVINPRQRKSKWRNRMMEVVNAVVFFTEAARDGDGNPPSNPLPQLTKSTARQWAAAGVDYFYPKKKGEDDALLFDPEGIDMRDRSPSVMKSAERYRKSRAKKLKPIQKGMRNASSVEKRHAASAALRMCDFRNALTDHWASALENLAKDAPNPE